MNELVKLRQQIAELEKQATDLQKKNRPAVVADLREQMAAYGITAEELGRPAARVQKPRQPLAKAANSPKLKKPAVNRPGFRGGPLG